MSLHTNSTNVRSTWDYVEEEGATKPSSGTPPPATEPSSNPASDPDDPLIGRTLEGRYDIVERIGEGTFGTVYRGYHRKLARPVAIKILSDTIAVHPLWVRRFEREAQLLARVATRFTAGVYDSGQDDDAGYYIVMEYLHGTDLAERIFGRGPLGVLDFYSVLDQVGLALGAAHDENVVHLDIKSENIFLLQTPDDDGIQVKLLDFGIARLQRQAEPTGTAKEYGEDAPCGSPYTMSPEAIRSGNLDARSDIYSLGAVLYEALTGLPPFDANTVQSLLYKHLFEEAPSASAEDEADWITPAVDTLLKAMMAKAPEDRPQTVSEVVDRFLAVRDALERSWAEKYLVPSQAMRPAHRSHQPSIRRGVGERQRARTLQVSLNEVIVIDDDPLYRQLVRRKLTSKGFTVFATGITDDALNHLKLSYPLAIVVDLLMPVDGVTSIRLIRATGFTGPIYILSGLADTAVAEAAMRAGGDATFPKDRYAELATTIQNLRASQALGG